MFIKQEGGNKYPICRRCFTRIERILNEDETSRRLRESLEKLEKFFKELDDLGKFLKEL
jgi:hypothetical protein